MQISRILFAITLAIPTAPLSGATHRWNIRYTVAILCGAGAVGGVTLYYLRRKNGKNSVPQNGGKLIANSEAGEVTAEHSQTLVRTAANVQRVSTGQKLPCLKEVMAVLKDRALPASWIKEEASYTMLFLHTSLSKISCFKHQVPLDAIKEVGDGIYKFMGYDKFYPFDYEEFLNGNRDKVVARYMFESGIWEDSMLVVRVEPFNKKAAEPTKACRSWRFLRYCTDLRYYGPLVLWAGDENQMPGHCIDLRESTA